MNDLEAMKKEIKRRGGLAESFKEHVKEHPWTEDHRSSCESCKEAALRAELRRVPTIKRWVKPGTGGL